MKDEKDWSLASDDELIAEAKRRYPRGVKFKSYTKSIVESTGVFIYKSGSPCVVNMLINGGWDKGGKEITVCDVNSNWWAEIVSLPSPEPKAGDMVEVSNDGENFSGVTFKNTGGKLSDGLYIVEDNLSNVTFWGLIRIPQKSEVESKADEIIKAAIEGDENCEFLPLEDIKQLLIDIAKWGQQNPTQI